MNSQQRTDIWNSLLDAEMNAVYWDREAQRYSERDRYLAMGTAFMSSGTVIALLSPYQLVGKAISIAACIVSVVHALVFSRVRVKQVSSLAARYKELSIDLKLLWSLIQSKCADESKRWKKYEALSRREKEIDESAFTVNRKRMEQAQEQIYQARGLKHEHARSQGTTAATAAATATTAATATSANA